MQFLQETEPTPPERAGHRNACSRTWGRASPPQLSCSGLVRAGARRIAFHQRGHGVVRKGRCGRHDTQSRGERHTPADRKLSLRDIALLRCRAVARPGRDLNMCVEGARSSPGPTRPAKRYSVHAGWGTTPQYQPARAAVRSGRAHTFLADCDMVSVGLD